MVQSHCTPFIQRQPVSEVGVRFGQLKRNYAPASDFGLTGEQKNRQTDKRTDRLITLGRLQSGTIIMVYKYVFKCMFLH